MTSPRPAYLKSWFLFFLIASVGGFVLGGLLGAVAGAVMAANGVPPSRIVLTTAIMGFLVGVPISFFTFRWTVKTYIVEPLLERLAQPPSL